jgi:hypothetical protein
MKLMNADERRCLSEIVGVLESNLQPQMKLMNANERRCLPEMVGVLESK